MRVSGLRDMTGISLVEVRTISINKLEMTMRCCVDVMKRNEVTFLKVKLKELYFLLKTINKQGTSKFARSNRSNYQASYDIGN